MSAIFKVQLYLTDIAGSVPGSSTINQVSRMFLVTQYIWKLCFHYTVVSQECNSIMSSKTKIHTVIKKYFNAKIC